MKTLVNKNNPQIQITAPEIEICTRDCIGYYYVGSVGYCVKDRWTLVEEEPKHTEVWMEGRTIFEQDAKSQEVDLEKEAVAFCFDNGINITPYQATRLAKHFYELGLNARKEVDLEKVTEEYIEKRASLAPNESWDIEDIRAAVRFGAEWQKKRDKEWMEAKEKEFKDIRDTTRWVNRDLGYNDGFETGKERAFKQFSDILDKWEAHATEGMRVGASAYHQGKIALICDLRDWIKEQTKKQ